MKRKKLILAAVLAAVVLGLWFMQYSRTGREAIIIPDKIYAAGETVDIGENYFYSVNEHPQGYSLTIKNAKVIPMKEFLTSNGKDDNYIPPMGENGLPRSEYVYQLEISFNNLDNTQGGIEFIKYLMLNQSIVLELDENLVGICQPNLKDYAAFKLKPGKEKTFLLPFVPSPSLILSDADGLYRRMQNSPFYLCVSQFPVRKLVEVPLEG